MPFLLCLCEKCLAFEKTIEELGAFSGISHQPAILKLELQRLYLDPDSLWFSLPQLSLDIRLNVCSDSGDKIFALYWMVRLH